MEQAINQAVGQSTARFFMPGHKGKLASHDVTELPGTDNLHQPEGCIAEAQQKVAQVVGAGGTFFSVGGSTAGLHALILAVCNRGDKLIVDRGCHLSVIHAMVLYDITPVFVHPAFDQTFGVGCGIAAEQIAHAQQQHPEAKGVLITSPTYYGISSDVAALARQAHACRMPLLVDEAHGAHFPFGDGLPIPALEAGADGVVQSAHKTLPCLTQGALVHVGRNSLIDQTRLAQHLTMVQTTSPSYLLMSSIAQSVDYMATQGKERLGWLVTECDEVRRVLNACPPYVCMDGTNTKGAAYDPTRLVIGVPGGTRDISRRLQQQWDVMVELDDGLHLVCIPSVWNEQQDFHRLVQGLIALAPDYLGGDQSVVQPLPRTELACTPAQAFYAVTEAVPAQDATGRIAARSVYRTPPCMPVVCPGERVTAEIAALLGGQQIWCVKN